VKNQRAVELDQGGSRPDLGERGCSGINAADADQRKRAFDPDVGLRQRAERSLSRSHLGVEIRLDLFLAVPAPTSTFTTTDHVSSRDYANTVWQLAESGAKDKMKIVLMICIYSTWTKNTQLSSRNLACFCL
jgi:hypothetical protein